MANNFNLSDNKVSIDGYDVTYTTYRGNFTNDAMTVNADGLPNTTPVATTYTVTFTNSDNSGTSSTYTAQPFESVGNAIYEKKLSVSDYNPTYYYNESIVTVDCEIPIKSDITIDVKWTSVS